MDPERVAAIVAGFSRACAEFGCPLIGGETAEMPGTYAPDDYDLAGFIVGVVERDRLLTSRLVRSGDVIIGLPSTGLHTNGYSLARKVLFDTLGLDVGVRLPELGTTLGEALLAPHRGYLAALEPLIARRKIHALVHITGGGFRGNLPRSLPDGLAARIRTAAWEVPALFRLIQKGGSVSEEEMYRTFNMGIGMAAIVDPRDLHNVEHSLERRGETCLVIGSVEPGSGVTFE
jgi:phosphoribosylformylglycinamidine cyclo-ligase